jgi:sulfate/thiosulfate transport system permease protein
MTLLMAAKSRWRWRQHSLLPGFRLSMALTLFWLSAIVVIPLIGLAIRPWELGAAGVWAALSDERVLHALQLSFGAAALAALVNAPLGVLIAWVLVRYRFPGRRYLDALVDLPFALPTAVAGIALTAIYAPNGPLGSLFGHLGIKTAYNPVGIWIALLFVGLPFVVRSVQPVLQDLEIEVEEAANTLGATAFQRITQVVLPAVYPALLTGVGLAFGRAVGEYGSVIFIAGNLPGVSEIAPLLIVIKLEQYDYAGAAAVGLAMLAISFGALILINLAQTWLTRRGKA